MEENVLKVRSLARAKIYLVYQLMLLLLMMMTKNRMN